jgi:uncharacterized protein YjiS (DUF1127 family)
MLIFSLRRPAIRRIFLRRRLALLLSRLAAIRHAIEGRRALARMDARMLSDIGISSCQAAHEISRKPWDITPPDHGK